MKSNSLFIIAVISGLLLVATGCKPKQLSGQVFVVTQAGLNIPMGAIEVAVISGSDADALLSKKEVEIRNKSEEINGKIKSLNDQLTDSKTASDEARNKYLEAQKAENDFINNKLYATNKTYIEMLKRGNDTLAQGEAANTSNIRSSIPRGGQSFDRANFVSRMRADLERLGQELAKPLKQSRYQTGVAADKARGQYSSLLGQLRKQQTELKALRTPENYFTDFAPPTIEKTVTDSQGEFTILMPQKSAKIFAKGQRQVLDATEKYFWLIDAPTKVEKLVLSNNNLFAPP